MQLHSFRVVYILLFHCGMLYHRGNSGQKLRGRSWSPGTILQQNKNINYTQTGLQGDNSNYTQTALQYNSNSMQTVLQWHNKIDTQTAHIGKAFSPEEKRLSWGQLYGRRYLSPQKEKRKHFGLTYSHYALGVLSAQCHYYLSTKKNIHVNYLP